MAVDECRRECSGNGLGIVLGDTHADNGAIESEEGERLGIGGVGSRADNHRVHAQPVGEGLDMLAHGRALVVLREFGDVDKVLGAGGFDELLLAAVVDADYSEAHSLARQLNAQMAKATTSA